ncbi:MAG: hypothetical protein WCJ64_00880 [Rhodospirillaceae bacterium]
MTPALLNSMAKTMQRSFAPVMQAMTYVPAVSGQFGVKLAANVSVGASTVNFNNCPSQLISLNPGDTFTISPYSQKYTVNNAVVVSGAAATGVTFTPAITGASSAGAIVTVTKLYSLQVKAAVVGFDQSKAINTALITATTVKILVDASTMKYGGWVAIKPAVSDKITLPSGRIVVISAISLDAAAAFYTLLGN